MVMLFVVVGVVSALAAIFFAISIFDYYTRHKVMFTFLAPCLALLSVFCFTFPTYKQDEIVSTKHIELDTNSYEGKHYSSVVHIEFDEVKYHSWTYNWSSKPIVKNLRIESPDGLVITE